LTDVISYCRSHRRPYGSEGVRQHEAGGSPGGSPFGGGGGFGGGQQFTFNFGGRVGYLDLYA
jgi:hypothetical protein